MEDKNRPLFVDTSAFVALYAKNDQYHKIAIKFWDEIREEKLKFLTSNFVFGEAVTWMLYKAGKKAAREFGGYILENSDIFPIKLVLPDDEQVAWNLFKNLPVKTSYTDCTSFSLMKRFELTYAFTFDEHFTQAGFKTLPI